MYVAPTERPQQAPVGYNSLWGAAGSSAATATGGLYSKSDATCPSKSYNQSS